MSPVDNLFSYTAFCSDYSTSILSVWSAVMAIHSAWYQHKGKTHNAPQPGERKLLRLICCAKPFTTCQRLKLRVNTLAPFLNHVNDVNEQPCAVNYRDWLMEGCAGGILKGPQCILKLSFVLLNWEHKQCCDFLSFSDEIVCKGW